MTQQAEPYVLRADGRVHTADIRHVGAGPDDIVYTASRDNTAAACALPLVPSTAASDAIHSHTDEESTLNKDGNAAGHQTTVTALTSAPSATATAPDEIAPASLFVGHTAFVNFALYHPGVDVLGGEPCLVTGSNDQHVALWNVETLTVEAVLDGHAQGVCCGAIVTSAPSASTTSVGGGEEESGAGGSSTGDRFVGDIVTGDWGGVCLVFDHVTGRVKQVYSQHSVAIRGVAHLPGTLDIVSCSGDKTIHQWSLVTGATIAIYTGHKDVVQCICAINATTFATGSNDTTVRVWRVGSPSPVHVCHGHDSLVYTVAYNPLSHELLSASEDRTVRVWGPETSTNATHALQEEEEERKGNLQHPPAPTVAAAASGGGGSSGVCENTFSSWEVKQVLMHPCVVWCVTPILHSSHDRYAGDLLTGGADGVLRVWTRRDEHMASLEKLEALEAALAAQEIDAKVANVSAGLDVNAMPSVNQLHQHRGSREGERLFARNEAGAVEVYLWTNGRWEKMGVVVAGPEHQPFTGAPVSREKKLCRGKLYDYVFDVDVEGKMLQLPYNAGDSVFLTAQNFIVDNPGVVRSDSYEEIVNFIMAHIDPADVERIPGVRDNATGGGPGGSPAAHTAATSQSAGAATATAAAASSEWDSCDVFAQINAVGVQRKINELMSSVDSSGVRYEDIVARDVDPGQDGNVTAVCDELVALYRALPEKSRFPAMDALRCICAPNASQPRVQYAMVALRSLAPVLPPTSTEYVPSSDAEVLVTLRLTANVLAAFHRHHHHTPSAATAAAAASSGSSLTLDAAAAQTLLWAATQLPLSHVRSGSANVKAALVTVLRNAAVCLRSGAVAGVLDANSGEDVVQQLGVGVVRVAAQVLLFEPSGSPVAPSVLRSLLTLFPASSVAAAMPNAASWYVAAKAEAVKQLTFTLQALETGSSAVCRVLAADVLRNTA